MKEKEYMAYIDESGDPIFNENSSDIFFLGATIIKKDSYEKINTSLSDIKKKFNISELKSSSIRNFKRRYEICSQLCALDIQLFTIYVNKKELSGEWFQYRASFYKYIQNLLNHEIYLIFRKVSTEIDQYGSQDYQNSLKKYLTNQVQEELFEPQIQISSAKIESLIQISDFLSGTIRRSLRGDFADETENILELIKPIWKFRKKIPDEGKYVSPIIMDESTKYFTFCLDEVKRYLDHTKEDEENKAKIRTLEYLYNASIFESPSTYVFTDEIIDWLATLHINMSTEQFRNKVMGSLRDEGLIIGGSRKGLKIPTKIEDFMEYISFSTNMVLPILKRLKKAILLISTQTEFTAKSLINEEMKRILDEVPD